MANDKKDTPKDLRIKELYNVKNKVNGMSKFSDKLKDAQLSSGDVTEFEEKVYNASNLFTRKQIDYRRFKSFNRFGLIDPYFSNSYTREYLFFTRPDLNIFDGSNLNSQLTNNNYFTGAIMTNRRSLECLQDSTTSPQVWNFLLSNQVSSKLDEPSIASEMTQHNANLFGISQSFRDSSRFSEYSFEFNLEFTDTIDLDVYHFFKAYNEYCNLEYEIDLLPKMTYLNNSIRYKEFSIYKVVVNDYNRIIYYSKHIGVTPKGLPSDSMNEFDGITRFTIPMNAFHVVELNPYVLTEINLLSSRAMNNEIITADNIDKLCIPMYNKATSSANTDWGAVPYIQAEEEYLPNSAKKKLNYYLKWRKIV